MRALILAAATAAVAACTAPEAPPVPATPPSPETPPAAPTPVVWRCDAEGAQSLIGSHVGAVTFPQDANVRIACTTCPVTDDYRPDRLTLLFDEETGIIESARCV